MFLGPAGSIDRKKSSRTECIAQTTYFSATAMINNEFNTLEKNGPIYSSRYRTNFYQAPKINMDRLYLHTFGMKIA